jgi:hypothetical protein
VYVLLISTYTALTTSYALAIIWGTQFGEPDFECHLRFQLILESNVISEITDAGYVQICTATALHCLKIEGSHHFLKLGCFEKRYISIIQSFN